MFRALRYTGSIPRFRGGLERALIHPLMPKGVEHTR